ncbi:hypothetical protein C0995_001480 [Termitomyces sp. Mi166|nr:hypothetical protein C0995_001480 [Termitomyces sp. Mi166\
MSNDPSESVLILPDLLAEWPWKRKTNPHYPQAKAESSIWIRSFNAFTPYAQRAFDLCDFNLLASLVYPLESKAVLRAGCDFFNFVFLFDEYTDVATPHETQQMVTMVMDALRNPDRTRPAGECVVGEVARQFWNLSLKCACGGAQRRFIEAFDEYTTGVIQEVQDRAQNYLRNIDEYLALRRRTVGVMPSITFLQFELDLPDKIFEDPVVQRLTNICVEMTILSNDVYSYNLEEARGGERHNLVTVVMHHVNIGLNEAMRWIEDYNSKLVQDFLNDFDNIPSFGEEFQDDVNRYLDGMATWVRGNDCWSFEGGRYFAGNGLEYLQSRKAVLLPRNSLTPYALQRV